jgi:hypothetical protein
MICIEVSNLFLNYFDTFASVGITNPLRKTFLESGVIFPAGVSSRHQRIELPSIVVVLNRDAKFPNRTIRKLSLKAETFEHVALP